MYMQIVSQLCLPLWFHLTIVHTDVHADCVSIMFTTMVSLTIVHTDVHADCVSIMFTTMVSFNYCSQGCTCRLCLNYVYHYGFI